MVHWNALLSLDKGENRTSRAAQFQEYGSFSREVYSNHGEVENNEYRASCGGTLIVSQNVYCLNWHYRSHSLKKKKTAIISPWLNNIHRQGGPKSFPQNPFRSPAFSDPPPPFFSKKETKTPNKWDVFPCFFLCFKGKIRGAMFCVCFPFCFWERVSGYHVLCAFPWFSSRFQAKIRDLRSLRFPSLLIKI